MATSYLARWLQAALHDGCKLPCTMATSLLARRLQAGLRSPLKPALSVSHWEGCLPRGGKGVFLGAGRVSSSVQEGCLPRGGKGVFPEAGRVSSPRQEECLPRGRKGVSPGAVVGRMIIRPYEDPGERVAYKKGTHKGCPYEAVQMQGVHRRCTTLRSLTSPGSASAYCSAPSDLMGSGTNNASCRRYASCPSSH